MTKPALPSHSDLRGAARLATEATAGLADLVEAMHARISPLEGLPGLGNPCAPGRTSGITGLVYKTVRGVTRLAGGSVDALLGLLTPKLVPKLVPDASSSTRAGAQREAIVAALNGVLGDHLAATANPLATPMAFRRRGVALVLDKAALAQAMPDASPKLLLLLHGLCMNDRQWQQGGHDHGVALAQAQGWTPVYLHYNSGQHVSTNAQALAPLLEQLAALWPQPLHRMALLGHSMGGLLARSALHHAVQAGMRWPTQVSDLVCLGSPHHGAPLERAGNWVDILLGATPWSAPISRLTRLRSAGITDLRHAYLVDADWQGRDSFERRADHRLHLPLPTQVRCATVAATLSPAASRGVKGRVLGDGLVPLASALGRHRSAARTLAFAPDRQWVAHETGHIALLGRPEVCAQIEAWLA